MPTKFHSITGPKMLAIMPTRACPAACKHCGSFSGPHAKDKLSFSIIKEAIHQAKELDFAMVVFTGGEATIEWENLLCGISLGHNLGLRTRLVSNAHWAFSPEEAQRVVHLLQASGLDEINYSTGDEHTRFVPLDRVVTAMAASLDAGYSVDVMVEYRGTRRVTKASVLEHPLVKDHPRRDKIHITESPWMPLDPSRSGDYALGDTVTAANVHERGGCASVLQTYTVRPDGQIGACCGLGMELIPELSVGVSIGSTFIREAIEDSEGDFLKIWIRYKGPEKILAWAAAKNPAIAWEGMYAHNCQACHRIYRDPTVSQVIRENYEEVITEVLETVVFDEALFPTTHHSLTNQGS